MKTQVIIFALVAVTVALPTAEAAWEVRETSRTKTDFGDIVEVMVSTTGKVLRDDGIGALFGISRSLPHTLQIYPNPCFENISVLTEYAAIRNQVGLVRIHLTEKNGWYRLDSGPAVGIDATVARGGGHITLDPSTSPVVHKNFIRGIKKANILTMGFRHDEGELVFRFNLAGSTKALAKAETLCGG